MKKEIIPSLLLSCICLLLLSGIYPLVIWGIARFAPNKGEGVIVQAGNGKYYYENIGQNFSQDKYFWSRPSAVGYNAAGSGGSNKSPDNPEYLQTVSARIDTFLTHNPAVQKSDVPSDIVTASGSGLDPHISVQAATIQIRRVAAARRLDTARLAAMVNAHIESRMLGTAPQCINVLKLNIDLDNLTQSLKN